MMKPVRIATRRSKLALAQANCVRRLLLELDASLDIELVPVSTKGDSDKSDFIYKSGSVGLFTREVEKAVLNRKADIAVHSYKDLPAAETAGLVVVAVPKRQSAADVLVASVPAASVRDLPAGATVGTSSLRRIAQLHQIRDDIRCTALRGNVETRIKKVDTGQVNAIIIAHAGLIRLGMTDKISAVLDTADFTPAPAQGALAVQIRSDDAGLAGLAGQIDDRNSRITTRAERTVLAAIGGGCSIPIGVSAQVYQDKIKIDAMLCDIDGKRCIKLSSSSHIEEAGETARQLALKLLRAGGTQILNDIKAEKSGWVDGWMGKWVDEWMSG